MRLIAGRFALIDPIGQGGSGTVWRAFDQREAKYCAVKVVKHGDAEWLPRVVLEQGVRLTHPHVVSLYAWAADEDVLIAMDLVRGGSLATLVADHGPLPDHYAARLLGQLLAALECVHAAGLIHRDVKLSNVMLEPTGQGPPHSRLGDFGLTIPRDGPRLTQTGGVIGTPGYLSPEALEGAAPAVARDLYAAGVVAWQLLTGSRHAPDETPDPAVPPGVAPALWALVLELLAPDPHQRPPDTPTALWQLAEIAADLPATRPALSGLGVPIEVLDVVGPLPESWGPRGPESAPSPGSPAPALGGPGAVPASGNPAASYRPAARHALRRLRPLVPALAAAATVLIVVVAALLLTDGGRDDPGDGGNGGTGPGTATTAAPAPPAVRPPLPGVSAGELCGWQDVGTRETAEDGRLVECVYDGREYHWEPVGAGSQ